MPVVPTSLRACVLLLLPALMMGADDRAAVQPALSATLRPMRTDRPDFTESPYTVDAGHVQFEADFVNHATDREAGVRRTGWGVLPFNLRFGLTPELEMGVFVSSWQRETERPPLGASVTRSGFGDVTLRAKWNAFGNEGGTAFGVIADISFPTAENDLGDGRAEGAMILPVSWDLAEGWGLSAMTAVASASDGNGVRRVQWINSASLERELTHTVAVYAELVSMARIGPHVAYFDFGATWAATPDLQFDAGINWGLSRAGDDLQAFVGVSRRF